MCPECRDGKHLNCTGWVIDERDRVANCKCKERGHAPAEATP